MNYWKEAKWEDIYNPTLRQKIRDAYSDLTFTYIDAFSKTRPLEVGTWTEFIDDIENEKGEIVTPGNYEEMEEWFDWYMLYLGDIMAKEEFPNGIISDEKKRILDKEYDAEDLQSEEDYFSHYGCYLGDELGEVVKQRTIKQVMDAEGIETADSYAFDDTYKEKLAESLDAFFDEKDLEKYRNDPEVLKIYEEARERHKDNPNIYKFLTVCIENGGGDPTDLEEDLNDPEFLEYIDEWAKEV